MCENQNIQNPISSLPSNFRKLHYSLTVYLLIYIIKLFLFNTDLFFPFGVTMNCTFKIQMF